MITTGKYSLEQGIFEIKTEHWIRFIKKKLSHRKPNSSKILKVGNWGKKLSRFARTKAFRNLHLLVNIKKAHSPPNMVMIVVIVIFIENNTWKQSYSKFSLEYTYHSISIYLNNTEVRSTSQGIYSVLYEGIYMDSWINWHNNLVPQGMSLWLSV